MTTIQQLRELEAKAIPAPWYAGSFGGIDISGDGYEIIEFHKHPEPDGIATKPDGLGNSTVISSGSGEYAADAPSIKFAADLRNAAPYLFAVVEAAEALRECPRTYIEPEINALYSALANFRNAK